MRAAFMYSAGDVRMTDVPDPPMPDKAFDRTVGLEQTPQGYAAMDDATLGKCW